MRRRAVVGPSAGPCATRGTPASRPSCAFRCLRRLQRPARRKRGKGRWRALRFNKPEPGLLHHFVLRAWVCTYNVCLDAVPQRRTRKVSASGGERWAVYSGEAGNVEAVSIGRAHENVLVGAA